MQETAPGETAPGEITPKGLVATFLKEAAIGEGQRPLGDILLSVVASTSAAAKSVVEATQSSQKLAEAKNANSGRLETIRKSIEEQQEHFRRIEEVMRLLTQYISQPGVQRDFSKTALSANIKKTTSVIDEMKVYIEKFNSVSSCVDSCNQVEVLTQLVSLLEFVLTHIERLDSVELRRATMSMLTSLQPENNQAVPDQLLLEINDLIQFYGVRYITSEELRGQCRADLERMGIRFEKFYDTTPGKGYEILYPGLVYTSNPGRVLNLTRVRTVH